jgi:uncharacterized protein
MSGCEACSGGCGSQVQGAGIAEWEVAFVADCNLRCDYCNTGFGRAGGSARKMERAVRERFVPFVIEHSRGVPHVSLQFGTGETFVHFDEFIALVDELRAAARAAGIQLDFALPTNGVLLDRRRLELCAERGLHLRFSIDGPAALHDGRRRNAAGSPSHAKALANWRLYREICAGMEHPPGCGIASVVTDDSSLAQVDEYWRANGVPVYDAYLELPSRWVESSPEAVTARQARYLADLRAIAQREAERAGFPTFLSDFAGPSHLYQLWGRLLTGRLNPARCGVGNTVLGVDTVGDLYPCASFFGNPAMIVGSLERGLDRAKLAAIGRGVDELTKECETCEAAHLCTKGCAASTPERGITLNGEGGCDFFRGLVRVVEESYQVLSGAAASA